MLALAGLNARTSNLHHDTATHIYSLLNLIALVFAVPYSSSKLSSFPLGIP